MGNSVVKVCVENPDGSICNVEIQRNAITSCRDLCLGICQELLVNINDIMFEFYHPDQERYVSFPGHLKLDDIGGEIKLRYTERKVSLYTLGDSSDDLSSLSPSEDPQVPVELVEGIRNLSKKKFYPFSYARKICLVGKKGAGKSSLLNFLMSGDSEYICPVRPDHETKSISMHRYLSPFEAEIDVEELKKMMIQRDECEIDQFTIKSFCKSELEPLVLVDTPGFDEDTFFPLPNCSVKEEVEGGEEEEEEIRKKRDIMNVSSHQKNKRRILIEKVIKESNIVLFLVNPDELLREGEHSLFRFIARISELNQNIIIVLTKFDTIVDSIITEIKESHLSKKKKSSSNDTKETQQNVEEEEEIDPLNPEFLSKVILDRMKNLHRSFKFGAPVVCVQVKKEASVNGPNFFTTENLVDILLKYHPEQEGSFLYLRNLIYEKLSVEKRIPMGVLSGCMKKKKQKESKITTTGAVGAFSLGVMGAVGTGVVGGLGILGLAAGGLAIAGGAALLFTGVGEVLLLMGGGMIAAGAAVTAGSVAVGTTAIVVGSSATMALGSTASILLSKELAEYTLQVPSYSRLSMSAFHSKVENIIGTIQLKKSHWKQLMKYEQKSRIPLTEIKKKSSKKKKNKRNWGETYFRLERRDEVYRDTVVVRISDDDQYYLVEVIMKGSELVSIVDVFRVLQEQKVVSDEDVTPGQQQQEEIDDDNNMSRLIFDDSDEEEEELTSKKKKEVMDDNDDDGFVIIDKMKENIPFFIQQQQHQQQLKEKEDEDEKHVYDEDEEVLIMVGSLDDVGGFNGDDSTLLINKPEMSTFSKSNSFQHGGIVIDSSDSKIFEVNNNNDEHILMKDFSNQYEDDDDEVLFFSCPFCRNKEEELEKKMELQQLVHHMENNHIDDTSPIECPKCKVVIRNLYFHLIEHVIKSCGKK